MIHKRLQTSRFANHIANTKYNLKSHACENYRDHPRCDSKTYDGVLVAPNILLLRIRSQMCAASPFVLLSGARKSFGHAYAREV